MSTGERDRSASAPGPAEPEQDGAAAAAVSLEEALIGRAKAGDGEALRLLLTRHADPLYSRVILPRTGDPASAEARALRGGARTAGARAWVPHRS